MQQKYRKMFSFKLKRRIRLSKKAQNAFFLLLTSLPFAKQLKTL